jgi:hypothetical protein
MQATGASAEIAALMTAPDFPRSAEPVVLLALAGTGGPGAAATSSFLERGGDDAWAAAALAVATRRGASAWADAVHAARASSDLSVRRTAANALLLLAEPASACDLASLQAAESDLVVRRVMLQAIAASRHPSARTILEHVTRTDATEAIREVAARLARASLDPPGVGRVRPLRLAVAELLNRIERRGLRLAHRRHRAAGDGEATFHTSSAR